jgi:glycerophosphoryl diester phosphodiesterase
MVNRNHLRPGGAANGKQLEMTAEFSAKAAWMKGRPFAHRGLHDKTRGIYENTLSAVREAAARNFHIEVDLHPARDGVPMVFHDLELNRLTGKPGRVRDHTADELGRLAVGDSSDRIPTLRQLLGAVGGRVGLVLEMKGVAGEDAGFVPEIANALRGYGGPVAIMSFNHWLIEDVRRLAPHLTLGLTAEGDERLYATHAEIAARHAVDFVSYKISDLPCRFVAEFRKTGRPVITWTVRSPEDAGKSRLYADQITFEGFDPDAMSR